jgi:hypothetical protein
MTTGRINQIAGVALGKARRVPVPLLSFFPHFHFRLGRQVEKGDKKRRGSETNTRRQVRRDVARPNLKRVTRSPLIDSPSGSPSEH